MHKADIKRRLVSPSLSNKYTRTMAKNASSLSLVIESTDHFDSILEESMSKVSLSEKIPSSCDLRF